MKPGTLCRLKTDKPTAVRVIRYIRGRGTFVQFSAARYNRWYPVEDLILL